MVLMNRIGPVFTHFTDEKTEACGLLLVLQFPHIIPLQCGPILMYHQLELFSFEQNSLWLTSGQKELLGQ